MRSGPGPRLRTERLLLRPLEQADLGAYHLVMSQDEVGGQLPRGRGYTSEETQSLLTFWIGHWSQYGFGPWAVIESSTTTLIGHCGLRRLEEADWPIETELLYALGREHWGRGYATEAARATIGFGLGDLGLDGLVGFVRPDNHRSRAVLQRCDFAEIGRVERWGLDLLQHRLPAR